LPGVQANGIAQSMTIAWDIPSAVTPAFVVEALSLTVFGVGKGIAPFAGLLVPFLALSSLRVALGALLLTLGTVTAMFPLVLRSAFGLDAGFGAMLGRAVEWGVKRGTYSNEAGQGTGPHAAAAAEVAHPAQQGYVQAFSVYVDTLLVCSATAFMILSTGMY